MSKKNIPKKTVTQPKQPSSNISIFEKLDGFFNTKSLWVWLVPMALGLFTYLLLFDAKVSIGGDDSAYLMRAHLFISKGEFPYFQGPIYPMILGFFMLFAGINLYVLKLVSLFFILFSILLLYHAFKKQISLMVLFFALVLVGINSYIAFFASMTYSEASFIFGLSLLVFLFIKLFVENENSNPFDIKELTKILVISLFVFILSQIRFVGISTLGAVVVFFIFYKKYIHSILSIGFFGAFYTLYSLFKSSLDLPDGMSSQLELLMNIDPYDATKGQETVSGFIGRFFGNADLYLGKTFLIQLGLRPEMSTTNTLLTLIIFALLIGSFILFIKNKNKALVFTTLVLGAIMSLTFIVLQTYWDQDRMIVICYPLLFIVLLSGIYYLLKEKALKGLQLIFPILGIILLLISLSRTLPKLQANTLVVQKNMGGDKYYGFTDDWVNYLKMSEYVGETLPKETIVGSRKAGMSYVYSNGMTQYGINRIRTENPDELLNLLVENNVSYVIDASLRTNLNVNNGQVISTVLRFMYLIRTKYPNTFELVHTIGTSEPAFLYKVNLPDNIPEVIKENNESL